MSGWVAGAVVVGSIGGSLISSSAAKSAAGEQAAAARFAGDLQAQAQAESTELQREVFEQGVEERRPFVEAGTRAVGELEERVFAGPGEFRESPGFDFRVGEGVRALDQSAATRGKLLSGQQTKAVTQFGQDIASQEYEKFLNQFNQSLAPFQSLAGVGQTGVAQNTQAGQAFATNVGNITQTGASNVGASFQNVADVNAANRIQQANIASGTIDDLSSFFGKFRAQQQPQAGQRISGDNFQTSQFRVA